MRQKVEVSASQLLCDLSNEKQSIFDCNQKEKKPQPHKVTQPIFEFIQETLRKWVLRHPPARRHVVDLACTEIETHYEAFFTGACARNSYLPQVCGDREFKREVYSAAIIVAWNLVTFGLLEAIGEKRSDVARFEIAHDPFSYKNVTRFTDDLCTKLKEQLISEDEASAKTAPTVILN